MSGRARTAVPYLTMKPGPFVAQVDSVVSRTPQARRRLDPIVVPDLRRNTTSPHA